MTVSKEQLDELLALMLKRDENYVYRPRPRSQSEWERLCYDFNRQQRCEHSKGGRLGRRTSWHRDSSVHRHMFIDGSEKIWCAYCPFQVWNKPEFAFKWQFGLKLWEQGREHMSTSERPVPEFMGPPAGRGELRFNDLPSKHDVPLKDKEGPIKGRQPSVLDWRPE